MSSNLLKNLVLQFSKKNNEFKKPSDVNNVEDLPERFFFGTIVKETFSLTSLGWKVQYQNSYNKNNKVSISRNNNSLIIHLDWSNTSMGIAKTINENLRFEDCIKGVTIPKLWNDILKKNIEEKYNCLFITEQQETSTVGFPDGFLNEIVLPVSLSNCLKLKELVQSLNEKKLQSNYVIEFLLGSTIVNYIVGKNSKTFSSPNSIALYHFKNLGIPSTLPELQKAKDGSSAYTTARTHYFLKISCAFHDIESVLEILSQINFLSKKENINEEGYPNSEEFKCLVGFGTFSYLIKDFSFFDSKNTKRIFYPKISDIMEMKGKEPNSDPKVFFECILKFAKQTDTMIKTILNI